MSVYADTPSPFKKKSRYITVNGEQYGPYSGDGTARKIAGRADKHLAELIRPGAEDMSISEGRCGRWS